MRYSNVKQFKINYKDYLDGGNETQMWISINNLMWQVLYESISTIIKKMTPINTLLSRYSNIPVTLDNTFQFYNVQKQMEKYTEEQIF